MATKTSSATLTRLTRFLEFLIGIFGALAIIGVFFKIQDWPNSEFFMIIGFMGEAAAFIIMGVFSLIGAFLVNDEDGANVSGGGTAMVAAGQPYDATGELSVSFREMMEERISDDLNLMMGALAKEVRRFGEEMHQMGTEMGEARTAVQNMRAELDEVARGTLAADTEQLGQSIRHLGREMHQMGTEMEQSRRAVEEARGVLSKVASSDLAGDAERFERGMRLLSEEVHEMSTEMGPARNAVHGMRTELERVVNGDLAGDAERLGEGMKVLGSEMEQAGATVEDIRTDLEHMAARFRLFNNPAHLSENTSSQNNKPGHLS